MTSGPPVQKEADWKVCWICGDEYVYNITRALLRGETAAPTNPSDGVGTLSGVNVTLRCLTNAPAQSHLPSYIQKITANASYVIYVGICGSRSPKFKVGDVVITHGKSKEPGESSQPGQNALQRALQVFQKEVGTDGTWLRFSCPTMSETFPRALFDGEELHYEPGMSGALSTGENGLIFDFNNEAREFMDMLFEDTQVHQPPAISIHGIGQRAESASSSINQWREYAAANAVSCGIELLHEMTANMPTSIDSIRGTSKIVPPFAEPRLPPFPKHHHQFTSSSSSSSSSDGKILLVIPTANKSKVKLLKDRFGELSLQGHPIQSIVVPFESGVGEQPYNSAGVLGAHNRISNALRYLNTAETQSKLSLHTFSTVIVACIESYLELEHMAGQPTDYGVIVIHNATTGKTNACLSQGTTISPHYVERARRFGFEDDPNHGKVTVGTCLAANIPGLDKGNWHEVVAGCSRYKLLADAVAKLDIPW